MQTSHPHGEELSPQRGGSVSNHEGGETIALQERTDLWNPSWFETPGCAGLLTMRESWIA